MKQLFITVLSMPIILCSCMEDSLVDELSSKGVSIEQANVAVSRVCESEDDFEYMFQTDYLGLLISSIEQVEANQYELSLTHEDAKELGIPDSIYLSAIKIVDSYNMLSNSK